MAKPRMMFYNDGRHPLIYQYEPPIHKKEFESAVDELAGTAIEALMFCLGDGRTVLHDTKVGELWGHNVGKWPHILFHRAHKNAKHLIEEGNDPLRIVCDRAHAKGLLFYPTLLVQTPTGERGEDVRCSDFRFSNKHLEINAKGDLNPNVRGYTGLDFKHQEVRDERFALIDEVLTNYPVDGFELQLNYSPNFFHPNEVEEGRKTMTEWVQRVYEAVKRSGPQRELAIRIPASIEGCLSLGLDPQEWIEQGVVDVLIGSTFQGPELVDPMTDYRPLVEAAKGSNCRVHATVQSLVDSDRIGHSPIEVTRATATNYWAQGVDGLYIAYWHGLWPYDASFYEKLRELLHPDIMASKDKFYFVPTEMVRFPRPEAEAGITMQLPADLEVNRPAKVYFTISDDLPRWDSMGRVHEVLLRVRVVDSTEADRYAVKLNGVALPDSLRRTVNHFYGKGSPRQKTRGYWYVFKLDREHWPVQGRNTVEVTLLQRDPDVMPTPYLRDVEIETKYLMGRNYYRGIADPDMGPCNVP